MRYCLKIPLVFLIVTSCVFADTSLTIYNQGFGVIRESLPIELKKGENQIEFNGVTQLLEPDSVVFQSRKSDSYFVISEQNYRDDPLSVNSLMKKFEGQVISFEQKYADGIRTIEGRIIKAPSQGVSRYPHNNGYSQIIEVDGKWHLQSPGTPIFPPLPKGTLLKPTLQWKIHSEKALKDEAELAYLSGGLRWEADYNIVAPEESDEVSITGWVTLENNCGVDLNDAKIKLVAGSVNKIVARNQPRAKAYSRTLGAEGSFGSHKVTEKSFDDYHMYSLPNRMDFFQNESKQVEFFRASGVKAKRVYAYSGNKIDPRNSSRYRYHSSINNNKQLGGDFNKKVSILREFENTKNNNLGIPLPKGVIRFYRKDKEDGQLEFVGENVISHTPKEETVSLYTGAAFDLVGERVRKDFKIDGRTKTLTEVYEITLRNHKKEDVQIKVSESMWRWSNWKISESSLRHTKKNSETIEFLVPVKADGESKVTYTVSYNWDRP